MTAIERLTAPGKKKLLALDGGGIRGALTIEVLAEIERTLRIALDKPTLVLGDYFDYIGGTSTGAIIAATLALGMDTQALRQFYKESGKEMFDKAAWRRRFRFKYAGDAMTWRLQNVFGIDTLLSSEKLRTLLLMVVRNATTDSPWPISNNPAAKYNNTGDDQDNLKLPLWQLVRASTAAPTYFPPEEIPIGNHRFLFVDGGITMYNNPAFQLFLMATIPPYRIGWPTGEDSMLVVSVGTGYAPDANEDLDPSEMNLIYNAKSVPAALMAAALHEQDLLCRVFGRCLVGDPLDREIGDLKGVRPAYGRGLFTYLRYNADLTSSGLSRLGVNVEPERVQKLDAVEAIGELQEVGRAVAKSVDVAHYAGFLDVI
jgi:patatin-like phospholipase/acyl hydrolase